MKCKYESCQNDILKQQNKGPRRLFCNEKCTRKQAVADKRRRLKTQIVEYLGGSCVRCGWREHQSGLVAHHLDPSEKKFGVAASGNIKSWDRLKEEADKCILLCQNCHAVVHATKDKKYIK